MYEVVKEKCSPVFGNFDWFKILSPEGLSPQAYLNQDLANKVCEKLNSEPRLTDIEKAIIIAKAEEKRLQKLVN